MAEEEGVALALLVSVALALAEHDSVDKALPEEVAVAKLDKELVLVTVEVLPVPVPVIKQDEELLNVSVPLALGVPVWSLVSEALGLDVTSAVTVEKEDAIWLRKVLSVMLIEREELTLAVEVGAGDGDVLRRVAMLRPRKVMAERDASASPISHSVDSRMPLEKALEGIN